MIDITSNVRDVIKRFKALPGHIERAALQTSKGVSDAITKAMKRPGLPVRYPIDWDSPRQQRKVMALLHAQGGPPYRRTGGYINAWQTRAIAGGHQSENIGHNAVFLAGAPSGNIIGKKVTASGQSHIHAGRWQLVRPVIQFVVSKLPERLLKALKVEVNV